MLLYNFSDTKRLKSSLDFKNVFDNTQYKVHQPNFLFLATVNTLPESRLGLVVAKKKVRRAHERNRIKRLTRESFRLNIPNAFPMDIVVMPKVGIEQVPNSELFKQLSAAWPRLQYLAKKKVSQSSS